MLYARNGSSNAIQPKLVERTMTAKEWGAKESTPMLTVDDIRLGTLRIKFDGYVVSVETKLRGERVSRMDWMPVREGSSSGRELHKVSPVTSRIASK